MLILWSITISLWIFISVWGYCLAGKASYGQNRAPGSKSNAVNANPVHPGHAWGIIGVLSFLTKMESRWILPFPDTPAPSGRFKIWQKSVLSSAPPSSSPPWPGNKKVVKRQGEYQFVSWRIMKCPPLLDSLLSPRILMNILLLARKCFKINHIPPFALKKISIRRGADSTRCRKRSTGMLALVVSNFLLFIFIKPLFN